MTTLTKTKRELKEHVVTLKLAGTLVQVVDREAEAEGLTRSAIIRRVLLQHYQDRKEP